MRQPAYRDVAYRAIGDLANSDFVMTQSFWIGVYPGLTETMLDFAAAKIEEFLLRN